MNGKQLQQKSVDNGDNISYLSISFLQTIAKNARKMAQFKLAWIIADFLGFGSLFLGWISNLDNVRSAVLFILGSIYAMIRIYWSHVHNRNKDVREKWEQQVREYEWKKQNQSSN